MSLPADPAPTSPYGTERLSPKEVKYISYQPSAHQYPSPKSTEGGEAQEENMSSHTALLEGGFQVVRGDKSTQQTQD